MFELIPFDRRNHSVSAFDPFRAFDDMERSFFRDVPSVASFRTDVTDTGDAYKLEAELPGFKKEDVKLDLQNGYLTITANRSEDLDEKDNEGRYIRQERCTGSCARSFYVGENLKPTDVAAKFENGILELKLPKADKQIPEKPTTLIEIQ